MVEIHREFEEELQRIREKTINEPTHFIIYIPYWDAMIKDFVGNAAIETHPHANPNVTTYMGLEPIVIGLDELYACSDNIRSTLENGGVVFLRLPLFKKGV